MTWATPMPILVFLGLSGLELRPMFATDRRQTEHRLMFPPVRGVGIIMQLDGSHFILNFVTLGA